jgi:hypothetical protein
LRDEPGVLQSAQGHVNTIAALIAIVNALARLAQDSPLVLADPGFALGI